MNDVNDNGDQTQLSPGDSEKRNTHRRLKQRLDPSLGLTLSLTLGAIFWLALGPFIRIYMAIAPPGVPNILDTDYPLVHDSRGLTLTLAPMLVAFAVAVGLHRWQPNIDDYRTIGTLGTAVILTEFALAFLVVDASVGALQASSIRPAEVVVPAAVGAIAIYTANAALSASDIFGEIHFPLQLKSLERTEREILRPWLERPAPSVTKARLALRLLAWNAIPGLIYGFGLGVTLNDTGTLIAIPLLTTLASVGACLIVSLPASVPKRSAGAYAVLSSIVSTLTPTFLILLGVSLFPLTEDAMDKGALIVGIAAIGAQGILYVLVSFERPVAARTTGLILLCRAWNHRSIRRYKKNIASLRKKLDALEPQ
ncbi:hypothetical protein [Brachybacterium phenoliresistens]|uniref:hypothetical protein n=1 Tax=Brachybacterium phenoliresistens TaxID=396014 RepID=UPI0012EC567E|nr:hypothetical protein [Brachybacterium phenoliresistens]